MPPTRNAPTTGLNSSRCIRRTTTTSRGPTAPFRLSSAIRGDAGLMKVLITGGTGFVGAWTAKAVQDGGHQVKFLVRNPDRLHTSAAQIGVDVSDHVVGDIADPDSTAAALAGCDAVIHCAAMVSTDPARSEEMLRTNLEGARNVLGGATAAKMDPIIHVSSFSALFRPGLAMLHADLPVVGGPDGDGKPKAIVEALRRGLQARG